ncbi:helix-turn-helix domain-containing protein [Christensenella timonensis]|uniref:helix-turn-helix domain-containing protein n=1 Tax=Christensenella timonensis TaxID=1816678 RepID=UPI00083517CD|nr:helix-turn-helix transcriptional regulator [Christensenella timonensis]
MQKMIQNADFNQNLKRLRAEKGFSQNNLVSRMQTLGSNISRSGYSMIEIGARNIKVTDLVALQQIYKVDFAEFFKGIDPHE